MRYEDLKTGQIIPAKEYNKLALEKYNKDYEKYRESTATVKFPPQIAFYGFYSPRTGDHRKTGYVRKTTNGSHWFKTKREAVDYGANVCA